MEVRNRVKELRFVPAGSLIADPRNWRSHPKYQREALRLMLEKIGFADALIAREEDGDLILVDGHLRAEDSAPDQVVPVLILDVNEEEAGALIATLDPIGAMAQAEKEMLADLLAEIEDNDEQFGHLLALIDEQTPSTTKPAVSQPEQEPDSEPEPNPPPPRPQGTSEYVIITFRMSRDEYEEKMTVLATAVEMLGITPHVQDVR